MFIKNKAPFYRILAINSLLCYFQFDIYLFFKFYTNNLIFPTKYLQLNCNVQTYSQTLVLYILIFKIHYLAMH